MSAIVCWNCGKEGHSCDECRKPKDQAIIDAAKKKFWEERGQRSGEGELNRQPVEQQQRKKWGIKEEDAEEKKEVPSESASQPSAKASEGDCAKAPADHVMVSRSHARSVLSNLERTAESDDTVEMVAALRTLFSLD